MSGWYTKAAILLLTLLGLALLVGGRVVEVGSVSPDRLLFLLITAVSIFLLLLPSSIVLLARWRA